MNVKISTRNELENRCQEIEKDFNTVRDELAEYITSTKTKIEEMTSKMDGLHKEWIEIKEELNKRDGNSNKQ